MLEMMFATALQNDVVPCGHKHKQKRLAEASLFCLVIANDYDAANQGQYLNCIFRIRYHFLQFQFPFE